MGIPKKININNGYYGKNEYYYWSEYESKEEAYYYAKRIKEERRKEGMKIKYFVVESQEGWFLTVPKFVVYLNKDLKLL